MTIICIGFRRAAHPVPRLHGHSLCDSCYLKQYRAEHEAEIIKYQKEYRADSAYREQARIYMRMYRKRQS